MKEVSNGRGPRNRHGHLSPWLLLEQEESNKAKIEKKDNEQWKKAPSH